MALRGDYEGLRGSILHRSPLPSVDSVVSEFSAEEVCLKSHSERESLSTNSNSVLAVPSKLPFNNQNEPYIAVAPDECRFCKSKGHWKAQCPKKLKQQNYSQQQQGYRPPQDYRPPQGYRPLQGYRLPQGYSPGLLGYAPPQSYRPPQFNTAATVPPGSFIDTSMMAEQFQQFLSSQPLAMSASSSIGQLPQSSSGMPSSEWVLDSGAFHHMSSDSSSFSSLCPSSSISVMIADGTHMPLVGIGSIVMPHLFLPDVYHIPKLTLNLASVCQLCDSGI